MCSILLKKRNVSLVSIGLGNINTMTFKAKETFQGADVIIGEESMWETFKIFHKPYFNLSKPFEIYKFINEHAEYKNIAIAYYGDAGFYSGAVKMFQKFKDGGINIIVIPGTSSPVYLASKLKISWEDVKLSIIKLGLSEDSVLYDIGAGEGLNSIKAALDIPKGKVYAIDEKEENIELINKNKKKFKTENLEIAGGRIPEVLMNLDIPTHALIEESSENLEDILEVLLYKNPDIKIVIGEKKMGDCFK